MEEILFSLSKFIDNIVYLSNLSFFDLYWELFKWFGWIPFLFAILYGAKEIYLFKAKEHYRKNQKFILLAIDIPKDNEQTPKAVENILNQLAGAHTPIWFLDLIRSGAHQLPLSLEIVSLEGHIQFLIYANERLKSLVEAAIFAQYPQAKITEVSDYTEIFPNKYPNEEYDLWGAEFELVKSEVYPIKVYHSFGDPLTKDYKDPIAGFLEIMSRIGKGEYILYQILIEPISQDWAKKGKEEIDALLNRKKVSKKSIIDSVIDLPLKLLSAVGDLITGGSSGGGSNSGENTPSEIKVSELPPGDVLRLKLIDEKCSKIGFKSKIRLLYIAKHEVFNKAKVAYALIGAIKQFNTSDANSLKPGFVSAGDFLFEFRRRKILGERKMALFSAYKARDLYVGLQPYVLNVEELASLYHFPVVSVQTPLLKKIEISTAEPPHNLPRFSPELADEPILQRIKELERQSIKELYTKEKIETDPFDFDNDYFESRFAISKTKTIQDLEPPKPNNNQQDKK